MKSFERTKDCVAIVGFAATTREKAPWENEDYEIWIMNEEAHFDWCKRYHRVFQMHPRWNFTLAHNPNDPNHLYWLQDVVKPCRRCEGTKKFQAPNDILDCEECDENGQSIKDPRRSEAIIYMQKSHKDIPNSVAYPLKKISSKLNPQMKYDYFTSTVTYALALAIYMEFKVIEIYGVEMANGTEYGFQRANMEYWIGLGRGMGVDIRVHSTMGESLLHSQLYGYTNMKIGYRQDVEARMKNLEQQHGIAQTNMDRWHGKLREVRNLLETLELDDDTRKALEERSVAVETEYREHVGKFNFILGAEREVRNMGELYDAHFLREATGELEDGEEKN